MLLGFLTVGAISFNTNVDDAIKLADIEKVDKYDFEIFATTTDINLKDFEIFA